MSFRFRPQVATLEAREVPAAFSFVLANGAVGSGQFEMPAANPALASQSIVLPDITASFAGQALTVANLDDDATADFSYGVFLGVTANFRLPNPGVYDLIEITGGTAQTYEHPSYTQVQGAVTYDAADTEVTFTLPDGTVGVISYQIPWDEVDPTQASQSVTPIGFNLNIAGENIASGFTTAPTLTFEYGNLAGLNFAVGAIAGAGYSSLSMTGMAVTAVQGWNGALLNTTAVQTRPSAVFLMISNPADKKTDNIPTGTLAIRARLESASGHTYEYYSAVSPGLTIEEVVSVLSTNMKDDGWDVVLLEGGRGFMVKGWKGPNGNLDKLKKAGAYYKDIQPAAQPKVYTNGVTKQVYQEGSIFVPGWWQN